MYYILVIKGKTKSEVMDVCTLALEYEQVKDEVHCTHTLKSTAITDANELINAHPETKCEVWKMKQINKGSYNVLEWDKKVWEK